MTANRPRPVPTRESRPFWDGLAAHELRLPWCAACGRFEHPRTIGCPRCLGEPEWRAVSGRARLLSWTVVRRPFVQGFAPPYVVGQVSPEEQPDLALDTAIESAPARLWIGAPVRAVFHDDPRGFSVHAFRLRGEAVDMGAEKLES